MKKILLALSVCALATACNTLGENEFELKGTVDTTLNGKKVYIFKQGGMMGGIPIDTTVIEDGKYVFKDTVSEPHICYINIEGITPMNRADFVLEHGTIKIETDKDTLQKSVRSGTYNNEKLQEFYALNKDFNKERTDFVNQNRTVYQNAMVSKDTATTNRLDKKLKEFAKRNEEMSLKFIKDNPKAYINLYLLRGLIQSSELSKEELKKLYNDLDEDLRNYKMGKELGKTLNETQEEESAEDIQAQIDSNKASVEVGKKAPDFSAPTPDGKTMSLKDAMGKVTIIDFWASWCGPCRKENPNVVEMYNELHPKGLNIIGVSLDKDAAKWKKAIEDDKLTWSHISNLQYWQDPIARLYGVDGIPATFVLDADGVIAAHNLRGNELKAKVEELLSK